jgi:hypothetical protein
MAEANLIMRMQRMQYIACTMGERNAFVGES